jgi:hypothetical protein
MASRYDWGAIQQYHEQGHSVAECRRVFGFAKASWEHAARAGLVRYVSPSSARDLGEKHCGSCRRTLPLDRFSRKGSSFQSNCKECQVFMRHASYEKKKAYYRARIETRREEMHTWLDGIKSGLKCTSCGFNHPAALQFHHRDPAEKQFEIMVAVRRGWSKNRILSEIEKCDPLCANCHFILHWEKRRSHTAA